MTVHKHYEKLCAKALNMDLVLFSEHIDGGWVVSGANLPSNESLKYFLCLQQHKDTCLYWLNGGDVQWCDTTHQGWVDKDNYVDDLKGREFFYGNAFMLEDNKFRIKTTNKKRF